MDRQKLIRMRAITDELLQHRDECLHDAVRLIAQEAQKGGSIGIDAIGEYLTLAGWDDLLPPEGEAG